MKKIAFSICVTLLLAGFSVAQEEAAVAPPLTPRPDVAPVAEVVEAVVEEATGVADAPAAPAEAAAQAAESVVVEQGTIVEGTPIFYPGQIIQGGACGQGCNQGVIYSENQIVASGQSVLSEPVPMAVQAAPVVSVDPFAAPSIVAPTPVANCTPAPACVDCDDSNNGRRIFRTVATRGRSMFTRVRGIFGRRR